MYRVCILLAVASALAFGIGQSANQRSYVAGYFALELDRLPVGTLSSAAGGNCVADVVDEAVGRDGVVKKHIGGVKYEDISIAGGTGMRKDMLTWIKDSFDHKYSRRNGAIVAADYNFNEQSRREFQNALITEISLPALDAASKDAAKMTIKLSPEAVRYVPGSGERYPIDAKTQKKWLPANFRLTIDGLEAACKRVNKIEAITLKQKAVENPAGELQLVPQPSPLVITLPELDAKGFYDWHDDFVIKGNNGDDAEKGGALEYLAPDLQEVLFTLTFKNLGIFKVAPDKVESGSESIRRIKVEMYVEEMRFDFSPGVASPP